MFESLCNHRVDLVWSVRSYAEQAGSLGNFNALAIDDVVARLRATGRVPANKLQRNCVNRKTCWNKGFRVDYRVDTAADAAGEAI
jgi:hypothetical protein